MDPRAGEGGGISRCRRLVQRPTQALLVGTGAVGEFGGFSRATGGERLLGGALGDDFGLLVFHV